MMEKIRYQHLQNEFDEFMDLIENRQAQLSPLQLSILFQLISKNSTNAIIHVGNLVIDGLIGPFDLGGIKAEDFKYVDN